MLASDDERLHEVAGKHRPGVVAVVNDSRTRTECSNARIYAQTSLPYTQHTFYGYLLASVIKLVANSSGEVIPN